MDFLMNGINLAANQLAQDQQFKQRMQMMQDPMLQMLMQQTVGLEGLPTQLPPELMMMLIGQA